MSLRSASPWTSTSSPSASCRATAWRISARIASRYASGASAPFLNAARAFRISGVCGNEPIVVVGSNGRFSRARCLRMRSAKGDGRRVSRSDNASSRRRTASERTRSERFREAPASREAVSAGAIAWVSPSTPRLSAAISSSFCTANASQPRISGASAFSRSRSTGTWSSEQLAETHSRSPSCSWAGLRLARAWSRLVRQILRPSTTPSDSTFDSG